ncbi:hypothetical protein CIW49_15195 [Mycolicibacterium sp. P1-18]|uniref:hypothetical protein n=1 Tax=Mycolicibacterium sp. P1-18 TaxID=2024615 RepID=UPI0011F0D090|nr:hypothetical protein [Mycolicibacterium sp. P1-18]KAA0098018.1 hypothetical protein CIW49_15195 [Mycolicibacterium sp. P1-18]
MNPYTVVVCAACASDGNSATLDALRATVRRSRHGMLVTTGCLWERPACAASAPGGVTVVVQPCDVDRRPDGPARRLGSVGPKDVRAVCRWLERGDWDAPLHLWWDARSRVGSHN